MGNIIKHEQQSSGRNISTVTYVILCSIQYMTCIC